MAADGFEASTCLDPGMISLSSSSVYVKLVKASLSVFRLRQTASNSADASQHVHKHAADAEEAADGCAPAVVLQCGTVIGAGCIFFTVEYLTEEIYTTAIDRLPEKNFKSPLHHTDAAER